MGYIKSHWAFLKPDCIYRQHKTQPRNFHHKRGDCAFDFVESLVFAFNVYSF